MIIVTTLKTTIWVEDPTINSVNIKPLVVISQVHVTFTHALSKDHLVDWLYNSTVDFAQPTVKVHLVQL